MARRGQPGHSARLVAERLATGTAMAAAVNDYLAAIGAKGFSPYTVAYRSRSLAHLVAWLAERGVDHPAEVTKPVLERYQRSLFHYRKADGNPLSFRTQVSYLVPVKALFKWLAQTNRILFNPASELELPRIERRLPKVVLNLGEIEAVLATPDLNDVIGVRDRAIMEVLYSTGMRRSELAHLRLHDVDVERGTVIIDQGKGRKDRMVPIGERALAWVDRYLIEVRPALVVLPDEGVLFLTVEGNDLTPDHLTERIGRYVRRATNKPGSCHTFRHTMATLMLEGGADIRHIQEILGHVQLSTTEIYTHVSIDALKAVHTRCHPGATNTRHRSPVSQPFSSPTERSEGGSPTERSDGGSVPESPTVPPHTAPPDTVPPVPVPRRTVVDGGGRPDTSRNDTAPSGTSRDLSAAGELLAALHAEAAEEAGENNDQLQEPGERG
jgi:integrase/recombinase XerD